MQLKDVLIVGAGPAGVSCAIALQQLGYMVAVVESSARCGGRLRELGTHSPSVGDSSAPSSAALALNVMTAGQSVDVRLGKSAIEALPGDKWVALLLSDGTMLGAKFLVLACGVSPRSGGLAPIPGRTIGPGPIEPGPLLAERSIAILGGGDSAFQTYLDYQRAGAGNITIFARHLRARAQLAHAVPEADIELGEYEVNPHRNEVNGRAFDEMRVCYGYGVPPSTLLGLGLKTTMEDLVLTDERYETSISRVFAIGDMVGKTRPSCSSAFAQGLVAAREIQRRLDDPVIDALRQRLMTRASVESSLT